MPGSRMVNEKRQSGRSQRLTPRNYWNMTTNCWKKFIFLFLLLPVLNLFAQPEDEDPMVEKFRNERTRETDQGFVFGFEEDRDWDKFPDAWTRKRGKEYAHYIDILLDPQEKKSGKASICFHFIGGRAGIQTGMLKIDSYFAYEFSAWVKARNLSRSRVSADIFWYDRKAQLLSQTHTKGLTAAGEWTNTRFRINQVPQGAVYAKLVCLVEGSDKKARVWIDDIRFLKRPRILFTSDREFNIFREKKVSFTININGLAAGNYLLNAKVRDYLGRDVYTTRIPIYFEKKDTYQRKFAPRIDQFGVYKSTFILYRDGEDIASTTASVAVLPPARERLKRSEEVFGVEFTASGIRDHVKHLRSLLALGVYNIKVVLWNEKYNPGTPEDSHRELRNFLKKSVDKKIRNIGVFGPVPGALREDVGVSGGGMADILRSEKDKWMDFFRQTIEMYGFFISIWQIGSNADESFSKKNKSRPAIRNFDILSRLSTWSEMGVPFSVQGKDAVAYVPFEEDRVQFVSVSCAPESDFKQLDRKLEMLKKKKGSDATNKDIWLNINLQSGRRSETDQLVDYVQKAVTARRHGMDMVVAVPYMDSGQGMVNDDYSLRPVFAGHQTVSSLLSNAEYMGTLRELGNDVYGYAFKRENDTVLAVWAAEDTVIRKQLYLGFRIQQIDLMGNTRELKTSKEGEQIFDVSGIPSFFTGLNTELTRTRISISLDDQISLFSRLTFQKQKISLHNNFKKPISGSFYINYPPGWQTRPPIIQFKVPGLESRTFEFEVVPSRIETPGRKEVQIDTTLVMGTRRYRFSSARPQKFESEFDVGVQTMLSQEGGMDVIVNVALSDRSTFNPEKSMSCNVFLEVPGQRALNNSISGLKKGGNAAIATFAIQDTRKIVGKKAIISILEIDGKRFHNQEVILTATGGKRD